MTHQLPDGLLDDVKVHLDITWSQANTDKKLQDIILLGMAYLDSKLGAVGDYTAPGDPRSLLFEYVRYRRDNALDVFESNYMGMILAMQNSRRVAAYAQETVSAGE